MMTKQTYVAVSATIAAEVEVQSYAIVDETPVLASLRVVSEGLADMFERDNPQFERARFLEACGVA